MLKLERVIVITGHYGSGKTNLALNLALLARESGEETALCDLDVVNPYFRTADFKDMARQNKIELFASDYANSNLDIPAISGGLEAAIYSGKTVIIDVGGDDAGAFALGRYSGCIRENPYMMLYVVNAYRYLMKDAAESASLLKSIEAASGLESTHIANCSNLGAETTADDIIKSQAHANKVSELTGKPVLLTAADKRLMGGLCGLRDIFPVGIYVKTPWN